MLLASSVSFVDATAVAVLKEMLESWTLRQIHFYIANAYGQPKALFESALGPKHAHLLDCSKSVDHWLDAELASRRESPRKPLSSQNFTRAFPPDAGTSSPTDDQTHPSKLRIGFVRSLPSFHNFQSQCSQSGSGWHPGDDADAAFYDRGDSVPPLGVGLELA